jgi:hypothetical protein
VDVVILTGGEVTGDLTAELDAGGGTAEDAGGDTGAGLVGLGAEDAGGDTGAGLVGLGAEDAGGETGAELVGLGAEDCAGAVGVSLAGLEDTAGLDDTTDLTETEAGEELAPPPLPLPAHLPPEDKVTSTQFFWSLTGVV